MASVRSISLRHLRAFIAVADAGSITVAASTLNRAESALSRSVKEIESQLAVKVFNRTAAGMALTSYGKALLLRGKSAASEFRLARETLAARVPGLNAPVFDMMFSEQRLQIFIALAQTRHMPTAAKAFGVSQPAVSAAVGDLEGSLGFPLFLRTSKGMTLTREGEILLFRTKRAFAELRHVVADIAALQGNMVGEIVVGSHPLSRASILPAAIARVLEVHPHLEISTVEAPSDDLIAGVRSGELDFILNTSRSGRASPDLADERLLVERMVVFVRSGHPLSRQPSVSRDDLMRALWVLPPSRTPTRELLDASFRAICGATPKIAVETSDFLVLRGLLVNSDLVTAASPQQLDFEARMGQVQPLAFELPQSARIIALTQRVKSHPSPGAQLLMSAIRDVVAELADDVEERAVAKRR